MASIYFKTNKNSETGKKMQVLIERGKKSKADLRKMAAELGAGSDILYNSIYIFGTGAVAFSFAEEPDMKHWKKVKEHPGFYMPRLSSKAGKEIERRISSLEKVEKSDVSEVIGWKNWFFTPGIRIGEDEYGFEIDSEWNHQMPEDCMEITFSQYEKI